LLKLVVCVMGILRASTKDVNPVIYNMRADVTALLSGHKTNKHEMKIP
jgi:hypothetical protein